MLFGGCPLVVGVVHEAGVKVTGFVGNFKADPFWFGKVLGFLVQLDLSYNQTCIFAKKFVYFPYKIADGNTGTLFFDLGAIA